MFSFETIAYAFLGGVLPAIVWLYFLLREDDRCPEPHSLIVIAFVAGMAAVPLVIGPERLFQAFANANFLACQDFNQTCLPVLLSWATVEETMKYLLAAIFILWRRAVNESIDLVVYMITVALGFAALENAFFLVGPLLDGNIFGPTGFIATDNLRFVGSTLVHIISSSAIGFALAFSYKLPQSVRALAASAGLILAIALHTAFNFLIIQPDGVHRLSAFFIVWTSAVVFLALFEILKYFRYRNLPTNTC